MTTDSRAIDPISREPADPDGPVYQHDRACCTYTGSGFVPAAFAGKPASYCDFYYCTEVQSVVARYGDDGPDYTSFPSCANRDISRLLALNPSWAEAYDHAVRAGLIADTRTPVPPEPPTTTGDPS